MYKKGDELICKKIYKSYNILANIGDRIIIKSENKAYWVYWVDDTLNKSFYGMRKSDLEEHFELIHVRRKKIIEETT